MREFRAKAIINASARNVFAALVDNEAFPQFDPSCARLEGRLERGAKIKFVAKDKAQSFTAQIILLRSPNEMVWQFGLPFHLLNRERTFTVIAKDDQTTEFHISETQSGPFLDIFMKKLPDQNQAFLHLAKGLKKFIESRP